MDAHRSKAMITKRRKCARRISPGAERNHPGHFSVSLCSLFKHLRHVPFHFHTFRRKNRFLRREPFQTSGHVTFWFLLTVTKAHPLSTDFRFKRTPGGLLKLLFLLPICSLNHWLQKEKLSPPSLNACAIC